MNEILNPWRVKVILKDCMFDSEQEIEKSENSIIIDGVGFRILLNKSKIRDHKQDIIDLLNELPEIYFHKYENFFGICYDKNDNLWTGLHKTMDALVCMGIAINRASLKTIANIPCVMIYKNDRL